jgi:hypothetical protein
MFFSNEQNKITIDRFMKKTDSIKFEDDVILKRINLSKVILNSIKSRPDDWDRKCQFNIKYVGEQLIKHLHDFDSIEPYVVDSIYVILFRFLCEFDFFIEGRGELSIDLRSVRESIQIDSSHMDKDLASQIVYASYTMPAHIIKDMINNPKISYFKEFEANVNKADKLKNTWDVEIENKTKEVKDLKEKLDTYKTGFNFVGLYQGFNELANKKKSEAFWSFIFLMIMAVFIIAPLVTELVLTTKTIISGGNIGVEHLFIIIPIFSIEIILIYFFRVILLNHRCIKAQLMQLELRQTLCQFIQSYTEYSSEIKKNDSGALEKFESVIFSGVISNPEKLPSTFDGIEQISKLLKSVKA